MAANLRAHGGFKAKPRRVDDRAMAKKRQEGHANLRWDLGLRSVGESWGCPECAPISYDEVLPDLWSDQPCEGCGRPLRAGFDVWALGSQLAALSAEIDSMTLAAGADGIDCDGGLDQAEASPDTPTTDPIPPVTRAKDIPRPRTTPVHVAGSQGPAPSA